MSITMHGPLCDVCGDYFLLDPEMFPFRVAGIARELHCHPRCRPVVEAGVWQDLPHGPLRKAFAEAAQAKEDAGVGVQGLDTLQGQGVAREPDTALGIERGEAMSETRNMNLSVSVVESTGTSVLVLIKIGEAKFWFSREIGTKEDAGAVASYLESALSEQIRHVRDVEYLRGYRDGRRRRAQRNSMACTLFMGEWMEKEAGK